MFFSSLLETVFLYIALAVLELRDLLGLGMHHNHPALLEKVLNC